MDCPTFYGGQMPVELGVTPDVVLWSLFLILYAVHEMRIC